MKKRMLSLALTLVMCLGLLAVPASAAASVTTVKPLEGGKPYGYTFSEGILSVWLAGETGNTFFDSSGSAIIDEFYAYGSPRAFSEGLVAVASWDGNWGYLDKTGKMVIAPQYGIAGDFHDGVARVQDKETKQWGIVDKSGNVVVPCTYGYSNAEDVHLRESSDGLILAYDAPNGYWGYYDTKGNVAIPFQYAYAEDFKGGIARVRLGQKETFIDKTGRDIISDQYDRSFSYQLTVDGEPAPLIVVRVADTGDDYYLLNGSGQVIAGPYSEFGREGNFSSGLLAVQKSRQWGYINTAGQEVIPCQFRTDAIFKDGYALVSDQDINAGIIITSTIINTEGQVTAKLMNSNHGYSGFATGTFSEGFLAAYSDASGKTRYGFINASGQPVVECKYEGVRAFYCGLAVVTDFTGKKGVINTAGQEVVPCKYDYISNFVNGVAVVSMPHHQGNFGTVAGYGLINTAGQEILPCKYYGSDRGTEEHNILTMFQLLNKHNEFSWILNNLDTGGYDFVHITTDYSPTTPTQPQQPAKSETAMPTNDKLTVNGKLADPTVYKIDGSNYFKIRDVAALLDGTEKQFAVGYDGALKSVTATTGQGYDKLDTDLVGAPAGGNKTADSSNDTIYVNGEKIDAVVYKIDGGNYFKLRDLGKALNFSVDWNREQGMIIDTSKPYTE